MSVTLYSCTGGAIPGTNSDAKVLDYVLSTVSHLCTAAWGIFVWVHVKSCESDVVFVLFGRNIPITTRGLQIFALFYFASMAAGAIYYLSGALAC